MKNTFKSLFACVCTFLISFTILLPPKLSYAVPSVDGQAFVLMDAKSGVILDSKNENEKLAPASTTKVMTAILVLEKAKFTDKVTVKHDFGSDTGTTIGLRKGEVVSVEDLLYGMLLLSANDCAITLAEHVGDSAEGFAELMNAKAKELGCENTNFVTSSGLNDKNHYTTAKDLSLIMKEALRYPDYIEISQQPNHEFKPSNIDGKKHWADNKNFMIAKTNNKGEFFYKNTLAGKTGYTPEANNTLITSAKKDDQTLIVSILNSKSNGMLNAKDLFEYGFKNFSTVKLYSAGDKIDTIDGAKKPIELSSSKDIFYTVKKGEEENINKSCKVLKADIKDSYKKGEKIVDGELTVNGEKFTTIALSSNKDISAGSGGSTGALKGKKIIIIIGVFLLLALVLVALFVIKKKKKTCSEKPKNIDTNKAKKESIMDALKASKKLEKNSVAENSEEFHEDESTNSYMDDYSDEYDDEYDDGYDNNYYEDNYTSKPSNNTKSAHKNITHNTPIMTNVKVNAGQQYKEKSASSDDIMQKLQMQAQKTNTQRQQPNTNLNNYQQKQPNYQNVQNYNQYPNSGTNNYRNNPQTQQPIRTGATNDVSMRNQPQRQPIRPQAQQPNRNIPNNGYSNQQQVVNNTVSPNNSMNGRQNSNLQQRPSNNRVNSGRTYPNNMDNNQQFNSNSVPNTNRTRNTPAPPNTNRTRNTSAPPNTRNTSNERTPNSSNNNYWNDNRF